MQYHNTRGAYQGIVDGTVDITICVSPSDQQLAYAEEIDWMLSEEGQCIIEKTGYVGMSFQQVFLYSSNLPEEGCMNAFMSFPPL